jgi:ABC-type dipeptide/oligopeptide/nickel transport system ATPase subunit
MATRRERSQPKWRSQTAPERPRPVPRPVTQGLVCDGVHFRYPTGTRPVLEDIHLEVRPGEIVALVGPNGSGKSTLVKLLCRFYDPQRGAVRWDGVDLRELTPAQLRARVAALFQDFMQAMTGREMTQVQADAYPLAVPGTLQEPDLDQHHQRKCGEDRERGRQDQACRGDDATGGGEGFEHALSGAETHGLLPGPAGQEDVVVDAERHQEQESQQRHRIVDALEPEDRVEDEHAAAEGCGE